jgi:hypothetical protein
MMADAIGADHPGPTLDGTREARLADGDIVHG